MKKSFLGHVIEKAWSCGDWKDTGKDREEPPAPEAELSG